MISKIPNFPTMTFSDVWDSLDKFMNDYENSPLEGSISDNGIKKLFFLLYSKYGNSPIANLDLNLFKIKVFATIFQFGPTWEKRMEIQKRIRELTDDELMARGKAIHNTAMNPQVSPGTGTDLELEYIDSQNVSNYKRGKMEALQNQWNLLISDVTEEFLARFKPLFMQIVLPVENTLFITEEVEYDY